MQQRRFLRFRVCDETFGLAVEHVVEVVRVVAISPVPAARPEVLGVVDMRGRAVPVLDLARALGAGDRPISLRMYIVVAAVCGETVGLLVDDVLDVDEAPEDAVVGSRMFAGAGSYAAAVARAGGGLVTLLELAPLLEHLEGLGRRADGAGSRRGADGPW